MSKLIGFLNQPIPNSRDKTGDVCILSIRKCLSGGFEPADLRALDISHGFAFCPKRLRLIALRDLHAPGT